jgi:hypothetical protein
LSARGLLSARRRPQATDASPCALSVQIAHEDASGGRPLQTRTRPESVGLRIGTSPDFRIGEESASRHLLPIRSEGNGCSPTSRGWCCLIAAVQRPAVTVRRDQCTDRGSERRRAAALARHYRDDEGLPIIEITRRLGRAEATVKGYLYDPSDANKRPTDSPQEQQFWALAGHVRTSIRKWLLGSRCDGTRPGFPDCPICPKAEARSPVQYSRRRGWIWVIAATRRPALRLAIHVRDNAVDPAAVSSRAVSAS